MRPSASHNPLFLFLAVLTFLPLVWSASPTSFCKCTCGSNSTIIPLTHPHSKSNTNTNSQDSSHHSLLFPKRDPIPAPDPNTNGNGNGNGNGKTGSGGQKPGGKPGPGSGSGLPVGGAAGTCADCNRQFCLDYNLPFCKGMREQDVFTTCFQRDSAKDEAVVFIFIIATVGLLVYAAIKPHAERWIETARQRRAYMPLSSSSRDSTIAASGAAAVAAATVSSSPSTRAGAGVGASANVDGGGGDVRDELVAH